VYLDYLPHIENDLPPASGRSLIASPFLKDPYFLRSVVYLCDYNEKGCFGFVLNKLFHQPLNELIPDTFDKELKVYIGGPVEPETIHFIHQYPELIADGVEVEKGVYWGGNFEKLTALINAGQVDMKYIKFFLGYAGWNPGQLEEELKEESWIVSESKKKLLFNKRRGQAVWEDYLTSLGEAYEMMKNFPIDPSLN